MVLVEYADVNITWNNKGRDSLLCRESILTGL